MAPGKKGPQLVSAQITPNKAHKPSTPASSAGESSEQPATVSKPRKPPKGDAELKRNALLSNPRGVRIYNANLENSKAVLAGYLLLRDTNALAALLAKEDNSNLLDAFFESRKRGFGIVNRNETSSWSCKAIFECIESASLVEQELFNCPTIPLKHEQLPRSTIKSTLPGYLTWINVMHRLIVQNEDSFKNDEQLSPYLGPHTAEDWYRAYSLIRYHHRMATQAAKQSKSNARKPLNLSAEAPKFLVDADYRASAVRDDNDIAVAVDADDSSGEDDEDEIDVAQDMDAELQDQIEKTYEEGALMLSAGGDLNVATKNCRRPPLSRAQVGRFLEAEGKKARVLHDVGKDPSDVMSQKIFQAAEAAASLSAVELDELQNNAYSQERQEFWKVMGNVSAISVPTPSYLDCCKALGIDPKTRPLGNGGRSFQPWQVIGIHQMLLMEESLLRGGINASDCGTGKTVTCLGLIEQSAKFQAEAVAAGTLVNHAYKPTLVACPSQLVDVWYEDWKQFFSGPGRLVLKQFYGSEAIITNPARKATLLGTKLEHLTHYLRTLDPLDPATARVVIVTAYSTWHKRTLMAEEAPHEENSKGKGRIAAAATAAPETDEGYDPDDEDELATANPRMIYTSSLKHHFDRVICDEAHALKNPGTLTHLAIKHLEASKMWFVSATPMINHVRDLGGYLALLWDEDWTLGEDLDLEDFYAEVQDASALIDSVDESKVGLITAINKGQNVFRLNPHRYRIVTGGDRLDSSLVGLALRAILSQIQLRHTMATVIDMGNGQMLQIGENIPHYRITTVELCMSRAQSQRYQLIYDQHVSSLYSGAAAAVAVTPAYSDRNNKSSALGPEEPRGRLNMVSHRRLVHATLNTHLETLVCSVGKRSLVKDINRWYKSANDFGVTHFFRHTRPAPYFLPYQDRLSMAEYMSGPSVKIQYLCLLLHKICIVEEKRVQIVVDMPMNQWHIEAFLVNLGLNVLSLRSAHSHPDRRETIRLFNDPTSLVDVLVTNFRTSSLGVNLQGCCSKTIIMDTAANVNTIIQTIGRIHRLGQKEVQDIYIVTVDHTYDQILQAKAANKMVAQLAGEARVQGDSQEEMEKVAEQLVTKILGQRCSRVDWLDLDLKAKDKLGQVRPCTQEQKHKESDERCRKDGNVSGRTRGAKATNKVARMDLDVDEDDAIMDTPTGKKSTREVLNEVSEAGFTEPIPPSEEYGVQLHTPAHNAVDQELGEASKVGSEDERAASSTVGKPEEKRQAPGSETASSSSPKRVRIA